MAKKLTLGNNAWKLLKHAREISPEPREAIASLLLAAAALARGCKEKEADWTYVTQLAWRDVHAA